MVCGNALKRTETASPAAPKGANLYFINVARPRTEHELLGTRTVVHHREASIRPENEPVRKGSRQRMPVAPEYPTQAPATSSELGAYPQLGGATACAPESAARIATSQACRRQPRPAGSSGKDTQRLGTPQCLGPTGRPCLAVDVPEVVADSFVGNPETTGDLLVPEATTQPRQHIQFP